MSIIEPTTFKSFSSKKLCMTEKESEVANYLIFKVENQTGKRLSDEELSKIFNQTFENAQFENTAKYFFEKNFQITPASFHRLIRLIRKKDELYLSFFLSNTPDSTKDKVEIKNSYFYSSIINHGKKRNGFFEIAKKAFEEAKNRKKADTLVHSNFMHVAKENNKLSDALKVYDDAKKNNLTDKVSHNIAIDILLELDEREKASKIVDNYILPTLSAKFEVFDFHYLSYGAAKCYIDHILKTSEKNQKIRIITGKGLHSNSNKLSEMRDLCRDYLEKNLHLCKIIQVSKGYIDFEIK